MIPLLPACKVLNDLIMMRKVMEGCVALYLLLLVLTKLALVTTRDIKILRGAMILMTLTLLKDPKALNIDEVTEETNGATIPAKASLSVKDLMLSMDPRVFMDPTVLKDLKMMDIFMIPNTAEILQNMRMSMAMKELIAATIPAKESGEVCAGHSVTHRLTTAQNTLASLYT
eukprot:TRINITY_DN42520_c0_g1_i1.p2 TRINITY_DN42520_c0_g1~~TRINITY_DN42520_c0_g1_i1.p2  ORF type:complete len:172 (-),score=45.59 TRINITY_DN42520_c0_g1_i1:12-527(-)